MLLYSPSICAQKLSLSLQDPAAGSWGWVGAIPGAFKLGSGRQLGPAAVWSWLRRLLGLALSTGFALFGFSFWFFFFLISERLQLVVFSPWEGYFWHFRSLLVPTGCEIQQFGIQQLFTVSFCLLLFCLLVNFYFFTCIYLYSFLIGGKGSVEPIQGGNLFQSVLLLNCLKPRHWN